MEIKFTEICFGAKKDSIEEYSVYVKTKKFIEDVARNVLGLTSPEDVLIKEGEGIPE